MILHDYADTDALHVGVAGALLAACTDAIAARGDAWLALAGGRTPLPAYRRFAAHPLPWPRVAIVPTDERCVPRGHPASNLAALADAFSNAPGIALHPLTSANGEAGASLLAARALLAARPTPFDAVVVGMGTDAHFASLFPGAVGLGPALDPAGSEAVVRIDPESLPPEAPFARISLTLSRLSHARAVHLVVTGAGKRAVLEAASATDDVQGYPVAALLHAGTAPLHVHWAA